MIALNAKDQLRQRMAWALSQILAIAAPSIFNKDDTEFYVTYMDSLVRNAHGNYFNILKEMSYSFIMSENLSFYDSKSTSYNWEKYKKVSYPDENYAREIMQLFSVGLCKLNRNGTEVKILDSDACELVYTNDDIVEQARVWTGFTRQAKRGNIESQDDNNRVDPMKIEAEWRDKFPKMGLDGKYIGDKYPLCSDLPSKHFLKKGAKYRLLGISNSPELHVDPQTWATDTATKRFILRKPSKGTSLYTKLCNPASNGYCRYQHIVELDKDYACLGDECLVDTVRVIQVNPGVFYEYVRKPCVEQALTQLELFK